MNNVILLGDSVFDNGLYVEPGEPDVAEQLSQQLGDEDQVNLLAVDGHITKQVSTQLENLNESCTHLIVSVGGNDLLSYLNVPDRIEEPVGNVGEAIDEFTDVKNLFQKNYRKMLEDVLSFNLPTAICTIYNGNFPDKQFQRRVNTMLPVMNDVIHEAAYERALPLLDLGRICDEDADYANPIEPSAHGGYKITDVIAELVRNYDFSRSQTTVFTG